MGRGVHPIFLRLPIEGKQEYNYIKQQAKNRYAQFFFIFMPKQQPKRSN
jgi:hypothetical protein